MLDERLYECNCIHKYHYVVKKSANLLVNKCHPT